jgi:hypothetical protein
VIIAVDNVAKLRGMRSGIHSFVVGEGGCSNQQFLSKKSKGIPVRGREGP